MEDESYFFHILLSYSFFLKNNYYLVQRADFHSAYFVWWLFKVVGTIINIDLIYVEDLWSKTVKLNLKDPTFTSWTIWQPITLQTQIKIRTKLRKKMFPCF